MSHLCLLECNAGCWTDTVVKRRSLLVSSRADLHLPLHRENYQETGLVEKQWYWRNQPGQCSASMTSLLVFFPSAHLNHFTANRTLLNIFEDKPQIAAFSFDSNTSNYSLLGIKLDFSKWREGGTQALGFYRLNCTVEYHGLLKYVNHANVNMSWWVRSLQLVQQITMSLSS